MRDRYHFNLSNKKAKKTSTKGKSAAARPKLLFILLDSETAEEPDSRKVSMRIPAPKIRAIAKSV